MWGGTKVYFCTAFSPYIVQEMRCTLIKIKHNKRTDKCWMSGRDKNALV